MALKEMALKEILSEMHDLIVGLMESAELLQKGLIYNNTKVIEEAAFPLTKVKGLEGPYTGELVREGKATPEAARYVSLPSHMGKMADNFGRISGAIEKKIKDGVLFSDRAIGELNFLFERAHDIMDNAKDLLLARNAIIANYIVQSEKEFTRAANDFATNHEERLIEGLCQPVASSIYIDMLDAFKGVVWHSREIARDLVEVNL